MGVLDAIADYNPTAFVKRNQQDAANIAATQAGTSQTQAVTEQARALTEKQLTENKIKQQELKDAEIDRQIMAGLATEPAAGAAATPNYVDDPRAYLQQAARRGMSAKAAMERVNGLVGLKQNLLKLTPDQVAAENALHGQVAASLQGYLDTPDDKKSQIYPQFYADATRIEPGLANELPKPGEGIAPTQADLAHVIGKVKLIGPLLQQALTKQQTSTSAAQQKVAEANTAKTQAELPGVQAESKLKQLKAENGIVGTDQFSTIFLPAYAANLGKKVSELTPKEKMASFSVFKQYDTNPEALQSLLASRTLTAAMHQQTMQNAQFQRGQQSYQFSSGALDRISKPVTEAVSRLGRLEDTLAQGSPQADALVAPELLTVMAGGQGSGLRMNEAEIARIVGGRSKWESLKANINKWNTDPSKANSITPDQRSQIRALVSEVSRKVREKQALVDEARSALSTSNDPMEHRKIIERLNKGVTTIDAGTGSQGSVIPSEVKAVLNNVGPGIHTLSDGSKWMKAQDGTITKQ